MSDCAEGDEVDSNDEGERLRERVQIQRAAGAYTWAALCLRTQDGSWRWGVVCSLAYRRELR